LGSGSRNCLVGINDRLGLDTELGEGGEHGSQPALVDKRSGDRHRIPLGAPEKADPQCSRRLADLLRQLAYARELRLSDP
jgi:hypothetical protein